MKVFTGIPISPGIAIGESFIYSQDLLIPKYSISDIQIELEKDRFHTALKKTKEDFLQLKLKIVNEMSKDEGDYQNLGDCR